MINYDKFTVNSFIVEFKIAAYTGTGCQPNLKTEDIDLSSDLLSNLYEPDSGFPEVRACR